ncbi:hypothetical protein AYJ54_23510 [Bradyrhizobium centrolobii]|uniref:Uncharacterized protein n=1 Tax=Bradyrhizobium centrolobii TaxID=1505087 RepID=A0A176YFB3_9BRAD|nr:hypothetical protein AYJ54_23510 [Bradyrhizobium centrolobii]
MGFARIKRELSSQLQGVATKIDDETRRGLALLRRYVPVCVEIILRVVAGVVQIPKMHGMVAAVHAAHPDARRRRLRGGGLRVHRTVMMSVVRSERSRTGEGEDSETDEKASAHSQLL